MKIYKVIVDKKPPMCFFCPLRNSGVRVEIKDCGKRGTNEKEGISAIEPDDRCILVEFKDE